MHIFFVDIASESTNDANETMPIRFVQKNYMQLD